MIVAVVGATGMLGREVTRQLVAGGHHVVAITRDPVRARELVPLGAEVRVGDLTDPPSLVAACRGAAVVVAAAHSLLGRGRYRHERVDDRGHRDLIDAAAAEGVRHFVYTSAFGASADHSMDFWRTKQAVEQHLKASGLSWTILRPTAFMEMHAYELIGKHVMAGRTTIILGRGDRPINFVAVRDVARLAVLAVTDAAAAGKTIEIGGPENLTQDQVAALYGRVCGRAPKIRHIPPGALRVLTALATPLHPGIGRVLRASLAAENQAFDPAGMLRDYPMALTRLEDVAGERFAAAGGPA